MFHKFERKILHQRSIIPKMIKLYFDKIMVSYVYVKYESMNRI